MAATDLPSWLAGNHSPRTVGIVDQDGYQFAVDSVDQGVFAAVNRPTARKQYRVDIVLRGGTLRVRKDFGHAPCRNSREYARHLLRWALMIEAAALIRLRGESHVPRVWIVNLWQSVIEMDYVAGSDLRQLWAVNSATPNYEAIDHRFAALLATEPESTTLGGAVVRLVQRTESIGVFPRDIHAGNVIVGAKTGRPYLVDFHLSYISARRTLPTQ